MPAAAGCVVSAPARGKSTTPSRGRRRAAGLAARALLLDGPALWTCRTRLRHWFDGLAMLHALRFEDGRVRYRSRFLQSADYARAPRPPAAMAGSRPTTDRPMGAEDLVLRRGTDKRGRDVAHRPAVDRDDRDAPRRRLRRRDAGHHRPVVFDDELRLHLMSAHGITDIWGDYWNVGVQLGPRCVYRLFRVRAGTTRRELIGSVRTAPRATCMRSR
jgi:hypothetical protein